MGEKEQYSLRGILRYEWIFGPGFLSYGGAEITRQLAAQVDWKPGFDVLDVGSGLGGAAFLLAEEHQARVLGVDLTPETVDLARTRAAEHTDADVSFRQGDIHDFEWDSQCFDVIWSRETLLHVPRKAELFKKFYHWMRPGGYLLVTDYGRRSGSGSEAFEAYVETSGYPLIDLAAYGRTISEAGFQPLETLDRSAMLVDQLEAQLAYLQAHEDRFLEQFTVDELDQLRRRLQVKRDACRDGDMKWGWFLGRKQA